MTDPQQIAGRLYEEMEKQVYSYSRNDAVDLIRKEFGEEWLPLSNNGNPSIHRKILYRLKKLSEYKWEYYGMESCWIRK